MRRYGDLVEATVAMVHLRRQAELPGDPPPCIAARIVPPEGHAGGKLDRVGWLTPYTAQTIGEDALRAGRGARLDVTVAPGTDATSLARVRAEFGWLGARGIQVTVTPDDPPRRRLPLPRADRAQPPGQVLRTGALTATNRPASFARMEPPKSEQ